MVYCLAFSQRTLMSNSNNYYNNFLESILHHSCFMVNRNFISCRPMPGIETFREVFLYSTPFS